jgi:hypothetical protein
MAPKQQNSRILRADHHNTSRPPKAAAAARGDAMEEDLPPEELATMAAVRAHKLAATVQRTTNSGGPLRVAN